MYEATTVNLYDMQERWAPSQQQITAAKALLQDMPSDCEAMVPIAMHSKAYGIWTADVEVEPIEGVYIVVYCGFHPKAGAVDYAMGVEIIERVAKVNSRNGTGSYAVIDADGNWAVFEAR